MTAFCSSDQTTQGISGTYIAKGVFRSHIIYEKTVASTTGRWWSLRFVKLGKYPKSNRWIFMHSAQQVTIGESIFGSIIKKYSNEPGYRFKSFKRNPRSFLKLHFSGFGRSDIASQGMFKKCTFAIDFPGKNQGSQYDFVSIRPRIFEKGRLSFQVVLV